MKKLGTPIGAGPGSANEKVGLAGVGTPLLVTGGGGVGGLAFFGLAFFGLGFGLAVGLLRLWPACPVPGFSFVGFLVLFGLEVGLVDVGWVVVVVVLVWVDPDEPWFEVGLWLGG